MIVNGRRFIKDKAPAVEIGVEPKYDWAAKNLELSGLVNTSAEYQGTATLKDFGVNGSKWAMNVSSKSGALATKETLSFKNDNVAVKVSGAYAFGDKPLVFDGYFRPLVPKLLMFDIRELTAF